MGKNDTVEVLPVYVNQKHSRKHAAKRCFGFLGALLVTLLILLGLAALIIWLVLRPIHSPSWSVEDVQVVTLNIQTRASRRLASVQQKTFLQNPLVNADIVFTLQGRNPNKKIDIIYDKIDVTAAYATVNLGQAPSIPPFTQGTLATTTVTTEQKAMSVPVTPSLGRALQGDILNDKIMFQIYVNMRARVKIGEYKSFGFGVKTTCDVATTAPLDGRPGQMLTRKCYT